ncbi:MAG: HEAT repeat domain-containing protein [Planctomycetes bacterium]|nr:HEAT repeat domain-containing protein [Planctomycetota bacterium]
MPRHRLAIQSQSVLQATIVALMSVTSGVADAAEDASHFIAPDGFVVEKVAGQPLVDYPLFGCFDDRGRLYVPEGTGLNVPGTELVKKPLGRITLLEDTDGDGRFDTSKLFADGLVFPQGILWHDGVVYTASHPNIWRLVDTDGDDRADQREVLVGKFGFNGNGCDIHGPFLGPDGYLYWTDGRHGHEIQRPEGDTLKGFAARIFRCRTDGTRIERIAGGGFDNPVELIFTPEGSIIGTMDQGSGDQILHFVEGGVYPRMDQPCVSELVHTGPPLGSVSSFSAALPVALCGMELIRSAHFGSEYQGLALTTQFNVHRIQQHTLTPDGATFRGTDEDFVLTFDPDVHPTDVFEDADGSLLMVDMGGWYNYGCPTSKIAKPEIKGCIYRIRREGAPKLDDPWGKALEWASLSPAHLAELLDDPRVKVRDKAIHQLAKRGPAAVQSLNEVVQADGRSLEARRNALWALTRIEYPDARAAVRAALAQKEASLRHVALHCVALERDAEATSALTPIVVTDEPALRLKAAEALGRIGHADTVPPLLESLRLGVTDRFLEHSLIYALVQIGDRASTLAALTDSNPNVRRAGLIALDQMKGGELTRELVVPLLDTDDPELQQATLEVISGHEGWSGEIVGLINEWIAGERLSEEQRRSLTGVLIAFCAEENIQTLVAQAMANSQTAIDTRLLLLQAMARCRLDSLPQRWLDSMADALAHPDARVRSEVVATIKSRDLEGFDKRLAELSEDATMPVELRIAALECIAPRQNGMPEKSFVLLTSHLTEDTEPLVAASAARALGASRLTDPQLTELAGSLADAGPLAVPLLTATYQKSRSAKVGMALVEALKRSPGTDALTAEDMRTLLKNFPSEVHSAAKPLVDKLVARQEEQAAHLTRVKLRLLRTKGDPDRGRKVFFSKKAACASCHRMENQGGAVGPDLSQIGRLRTSQDLVEAVVFPSSTITLGYRSYAIVTDKGRIHTGIIVRETSDAIYMRTAELAEIRLSRRSVDEMGESSVSIMPDGLEKTMSAQELSDMLEFLFNCR